MNKHAVLHISKRDGLPWYGAWAIRGGAILLALVVCAIVTTALTGENPIGVYKTMFAGAFGTKRKMWILGQNIAILLVVSLAVTPAFKMRFWNVGGEGQILIGGLATAACMIGIINQSTMAGWLPQIGSYKYLLNILVALVLTVIMYFYLTRSKQGYEIAVVGESERTARYVGIKVGKVIVRTMMLSGAVCGLAGLLLVSGTDHTITTTIADNRGFTAVMVAWLAKFNPFSMIFTSFLLVFLDRGASEISTIYSLNHSFGDILTGIILFFIIGSEFFISYKLNFLKNNRKEEK